MSLPQIEEIEGRGVSHPSPQSPDYDSAILRRLPETATVIPIKVSHPAAVFQMAPFTLPVCRHESRESLLITLQISHQPSTIHPIEAEIRSRPVYQTAHRHQVHT